ncbi:MAG: nucleotidyltransferase family protein [Dehalococcoidia bacterium]|nr:nucleotidyltransferase family protein [Dehalococcoidia bacterium]
MYALIIAGGRGERLRPLTDSAAKAMVPVNGKPILWYQARQLQGAGVTDIVLLCGYKGETIREYCGDGSSLGVRAHYSQEETPLGRGGALKQGLGMVPNSERAVLALNGDIITTQDFAPLLKLHQQTGAMATIMLVPYPSAYGVVDVEESGRVVAFKEKGELPHWINAGIYVLDTSIRDELPVLGDHETTTFPRLAERGKLYAYRSRAFWKAIDNHKDIREAEEGLRRGGGF